MVAQVDWKDYLRGVLKEKFVEFTERSKFKQALNELFPYDIADPILRRCFMNLSYCIEGLVGKHFGRVWERREGRKGNLEFELRLHEALLLQVLKPFLSRGEILEAIPEAERVKKEFGLKLASWARQLHDDIINGYRALLGELPNLARTIRAYLSIYEAWKRLEGDCALGKDRPLHLREIWIDEDPIQLVFCELIRRGVDIRYTPELIRSLEFSDCIGLTEPRFVEEFCDCLLTRRIDKAIKKLVARLCSVEGLKGKGRVIFDQVGTVISAFVRCDAKPTILSTREFLEQFFVQRALLEYYVFQELVNAGLPCLPRVMVEREGKERECNILVTLSRAKLVAIEVTLRDELGKVQKRSAEVKELIEGEGWHCESYVVSTQPLF